MNWDTVNRAIRLSSHSVGTGVRISLSVFFIAVLIVLNASTPLNTCGGNK
jgi:hypothetical protein